MEKLFVYGTLKYLPEDNDAVYCEDAYIVKGAYPALVGIGKGERLFYGQVIEVDETVLSILDDYEGVPNLYRRIKTETLLGDTVWVYEFTKQLYADCLTTYNNNYWIIG